MDVYAAANYVIAALQGQQNGGAANFQFKPHHRSSTPSGLPQLHTSVVQPGSSPHHPGTPLASDGGGSQSTEPAMPTLSPHPPSVKEEVVESAPMAASESQDQGGGVGAAAAAQSPAAGAPAASEANKEKAATDQVFIGFLCLVRSEP